MLKTQNANSPRGRQETILNQRDIINAIQQCPQIMKEDKLFIRNKIKQFYKEFQLDNPQGSIHNQIAQLLQIFSECRKPLNRIHLYENHSHWLQVKLRKYIATQRKKQKQQCLQQFRKQKYQERDKKSSKIIKRFKNEDFCSKEKYNHRSIYSSDIKNNNYSEYRKNHSPSQFYDSKRFIKTTKNKNLSGNSSPTYELGPKKFVWPQTCKNLNDYYDDPSSNRYDVKSRTYRAISANESKFQMSKSGHKQIATYENFNKFFSKEKKNSHFQKKQKQNEEANVGDSVMGNANYLKQCPYFHRKGNYGHDHLNQRQKGQDIERLISQNNSTSKKEDDISLDSYHTYEYRPKIQNFPKYEELSSIKQVRQGNDHSSSNLRMLTTFQQQSINQHLYTAPELLEECRRFIKKAENIHHDNKYQASKITKPLSKDSYKQNFKRQFQKIERSEISNAKVKEQNFQSFNVFENVQCIQYCSPQFQKYSTETERFKTMKDLLKYMFKKGWRIYLTNSEQEQILSRCPVGYEELVVLLVNQTEPKTKFINFMNLIPLLKKSLSMSFSFSNIFLLLDVDKKGTITKSDFQTFIENFIDCPIQPQVLLDLKQKLFKFQRVVYQTFKDHEITPGCFQYLQIIQNPQIFQLGQILQMFQFQIEADSNTFSNDFCD